MSRLLCYLIVASAVSAASAAETLTCYTASWCGPCKAFKADLASDPALAGGRQVVIVDVDVDKRAARRAKVRSMPTFVLIEDGVEKARKTGYDGPAGLKGWLEGR